MARKNSSNNSEIIIYNSDDGRTRVEVKLQDETVWLSQAQMSELFQKSQSTINEHIKNIYEEKELEQYQTMTKFGNSENSLGKPIYYYNLDVIISVGYRVKSLRGTQFRIWATQRLKEYIIKGFTMDDERLKEGGAKARYFQELLDRVRDIRSSERNFYQKVTDIYATSIDYRKDDKLTQEFFATVQNKMHYAVHGQTAAELIKARVDSKKPFMGLTSFKGKFITGHDAVVAKNYLTEKELKQLNLIVSLYLDFAELQATNERAMTMKEWIEKLDEFLKLSEKKILNSFGRVTSLEAINKAITEYEKYRVERNKNFVSDFDREVKKLLEKTGK